MEIKIKDKYIELAKLLKLAGLINTGGDFNFIKEIWTIKINNEVDNRKGRKVYIGDVVSVETEDQTTTITIC